jgi:hypothetical protein
MKHEVVWSPQSGPQTAFVSCPVFEVMYGGARGGGKTDAMLGDWLLHSNTYGENAKGVFFRHRLPQLEEVIARSHAIFRPLGAKWREQEKIWIMPGGARLKFRYLERLADAENYQGHDYTRLYFEELTNWSSPDPVFRLFATLRSAMGVPVGFRASCNPGGPGHHWVMERYINPAPGGYTILKDQIWNKRTGQYQTLERVFIPARVADNPKLSEADPYYEARLHLVGSEETVKAWLEGDWSIVEGAFFTEFSEAKHCIPPVALPSTWTRFVSADWGSAKPFAVGWFAVSDGSLLQFQKGQLIQYREWYGMTPGRPDVGIKMIAEVWGSGIRERSGSEHIAYSVLDPAAFASNGGPSIAERSGIDWGRADNRRLGEEGAMVGWDQVRARLVGDELGPGLVFFNTCIHTIRTLRSVQHDQAKPEDIDTDAEDHAVDMLRYGCMSRPWMAKVVQLRPKSEVKTFNEAMAAVHKRRLRRGR